MPPKNKKTKIKYYKSPIKPTLSVMTGMAKAKQAERLLKAEAKVIKAEAQLVKAKPSHVAPRRAKIDPNSHIRSEKFSEKIMDVTPNDTTYGSFKTLANFILNPGNMMLSQRLPFISNIYQTYRFKKLSLRWRSLSNPTTFADGSYGVGELMASVNLNSTDPPYTDENDMRLSSNYISHKCTQQKHLNLLKGSKVVPHPAGAWRFINVAYNNAAGIDSDLGVLQLAVNGLPVSSTVIGEWWIDYTVEFSEQKAPDFGGSTCLCFAAASTSPVPQALMAGATPNCTLPVLVVGTSYVGSGGGATVCIGKKGLYNVSIYAESTSGLNFSTPSALGDYVSIPSGGGFLGNQSNSAPVTLFDPTLTTWDGLIGRSSLQFQIEVTRDSILSPTNTTLNGILLSTDNPTRCFTIYITQLMGNLPVLRASGGFSTPAVSALERVKLTLLDSKLAEVERTLEKFKNLTLSIAESKNDDVDDPPVNVVSTTPVDKFYKQKNSDEVRVKKEARGFFSSLPLMAPHS
jgi:hypothetical protein